MLLYIRCVRWHVSQIMAVSIQVHKLLPGQVSVIRRESMLAHQVVTVLISLMIMLSLSLKHTVFLRVHLLRDVEWMLIISVVKIMVVCHFVYGLFIDWLVRVLPEHGLQMRLLLCRKQLLYRCSTHFVHFINKLYLIYSFR